jgi:hypothetical protein
MLKTPNSPILNFQNLRFCWVWRTKNGTWAQEYSFQIRTFAGDEALPPAIEFTGSVSLSVKLQPRRNKELHNLHR